MIKENIKSEIDFVVLWVDGSDPKWIKEKSKYIIENGDANVNRFRDCDSLQYLFRGIEKYAPWVNNIFFITYGHIPIWLDTKNEKIKIVRHDEFIPHEYLPIVSGKFLPMKIKFGKYYSISNDNSILIKDILYGKHKIICINDDKIDIDFDEKIIDIQNALNSKFNEKCSFEK